MDGSGEKSRNAGRTVRVMFLGVCGQLKVSYRESVCYNEELEIVEQFLCNCPALSKLELRTLGMGFFEGWNSVSGADIKALHRFIRSLR